MFRLSAFSKHWFPFSWDARRRKVPTITFVSCSSRVCFWKAFTTVTSCGSSYVSWLSWVLMAGVALEMQESPRHNFGQLPPRLLMESIRKSHLLRRSLACSRFLVSCKHDLSHRTFDAQFQSQADWPGSKNGWRRKETSVGKLRDCLWTRWGEGRDRNDHLLHKKGEWKHWRNWCACFFLFIFLKWRQLAISLFIEIDVPTKQIQITIWWWDEQACLLEWVSMHAHNNTPRWDFCKN